MNTSWWLFVFLTPLSACFCFVIGFLYGIRWIRQQKIDNFIKVETGIKKKRNRVPRPQPPPPPQQQQQFKPTRIKSKVQGFVKKNKRNKYIQQEEYYEQEEEEDVGVVYYEEEDA